LSAPGDRRSTRTRLSRLQDRDDRGGRRPIVAPEIGCTTDVDAILAAVSLRRSSSTSPTNNPTGTCISEQTSALTPACPHVLLVSTPPTYTSAERLQSGLARDLADNVVMTPSQAALRRFAWAGRRPAPVIDALNRVRAVQRCRARTGGRHRRNGDKAFSPCRGPQRAVAAARFSGLDSSASR
jgi:hypothetical protein